jgi:hypothetical protein
VVLAEGWMVARLTGRPSLVEVRNVQCSLCDRDSDRCEICKRGNTDIESE